MKNFTHGVWTCQVQFETSTEKITAIKIFTVSVWVRMTCLQFFMPYNRNNKSYGNFHTGVWCLQLAQIVFNFRHLHTSVIRFSSLGTLLYTKQKKNNRFNCTFGLLYITFVQFWSIGFKLRNFGPLGIMILLLWSPKVLIAHFWPLTYHDCAILVTKYPIVTIMSFCHYVDFNSKKLHDTREINLTLSWVTYELQSY